MSCHPVEGQGGERGLAQREPGDALRYACMCPTFGKRFSLAARAIPAAKIILAFVVSDVGRLGIKPFPLYTRILPGESERVDAAV